MKLKKTIPVPRAGIILCKKRKSRPDAIDYRQGPKTLCYNLTGKRSRRTAEAKQANLVSRFDKTFIHQDAQVSIDREWAAFFYGMFDDWRRVA